MSRLASKQQTFAERIADENKTLLAQSFIVFVKEIALGNNKSEDEIWANWQEYKRTCQSYDQSPVLGEFCNWYKLIA